jgi:hypothetical protein
MTTPALARLLRRLLTITAFTIVFASFFGFGWPLVILFYTGYKALMLWAEYL